VGVVLRVRVQPLVVPHPRHLGFLRLLLGISWLEPILQEGRVILIRTNVLSLLERGLQLSAGVFSRTLRLLVGRGGLELVKEVHSCLLRVHRLPLLLADLVLDVLVALVGGLLEGG